MDGLRGVLRSIFCWRDRDGVGGLLPGLRSSALVSLRKGTSLQGSVSIGEEATVGILQGVEEAGSLQNTSFTGLLNGPHPPWEQLSGEPFPRRQPSCPKGGLCSSVNESDPWLDGSSRMGSSSGRGRTKNCFLLDLPISCNSCLFGSGGISGGGCSRTAGCLFCFSGTGRNKQSSLSPCAGGSSAGNTIWNGAAHSSEWKRSLSFFIGRPVGNNSRLVSQASSFVDWWEADGDDSSPQ